MTLTHAPRFRISCTKGECEESFSTDSLEDAFEFIHTHRGHASHTPQWGSERYQIPDVHIGRYEIQCEECTDKQFGSSTEAEEYYQRHRQHTDHEVQQPEFVEEDLSTVPIDRIAKELTQREGFQDGVPAVVLLALAQGEHRSAQQAYFRFIEAVEGGDIYEAAENRYRPVETYFSA